MTYLAQIWDDQELLNQIDGLSIDAAREIAASAPMLGQTGRIFENGRDYCEVYPPNETPRRGRFAEVTYVRLNPTR